MARTVPEGPIIQLVLALMEATGQDEVRIPEEALVRKDPTEHLITYRDEMCDMRVYRRVVIKVLDGEEVPMPVAAIGGGA
jgi:hypothetical protein